MPIGRPIWYRDIATNDERDECPPLSAFRQHVEVMPLGPRLPIRDAVRERGSGRCRSSAIVGAIHLRSPSSFSHFPLMISGPAPTALVADGISPLSAMHEFSLPSLAQDVKPSHSVTARRCRYPRALRRAIRKADRLERCVVNREKEPADSADRLLLNASSPPAG